ncbi:UbiA-like protein EboC [Mucilaginibacter sp. JRF]|uniref:UbiA-like protein EboC n=1 Tax=Mucilaginibacter sp. JRF TaxID=2780088 RepID=UPI001D161F31|nr:UbiA-like protein EboC [Mucilaginibacter sp. JRF]
MSKTISYLRMMRPANIVTSVADVLAGIAITGIFADSGAFMMLGYLSTTLLLCFSTACLYGGGIVFNDVFDAELDKIERPERAIPSGIISKTSAATLGSVLLITGIAAAVFCGGLSGILAVAIAFFALLYNKISKHHPFFGPLNMGFCRGLNLLLGISILPDVLQHWYMLAVVPIIYIFCITMISRGEVHGGSKGNLYIASGLYSIVAGIIAYFGYRNGTLLLTAVFLIPFIWMIFRPLLKAIQQPVGKNIGAAVKAGVISLILMDAAWAATFSTFFVALLIACLLPLSMWLAKIFAVT